MSVYAVTNPATGEQVKTFPTLTDDELDSAIALAYDTYQNWLRPSRVEERAKLVRRVGELHRERREQLAEITTREMGKPLDQALGEVDFCVDIYGFYADNGPDLMKDEPIELLAGEGSAIIRRSPYGVILGIMPWNFPTYQVARFAGPNLVIGNAVLLKHAPQCPETAAALQQIYLDAGFPEGAYVNIYATNDQIAQVIDDPRVQGGSVTVSERDGAAVGAGVEPDGNYFSPMVLTDVTPDNNAYREELFGPVAVVYRVGSEEEAVKLANDTPFGLGSYLFTTDSEQADRVANKIEAGMVYVNIVLAAGAELPFG